MTNTVECTVVRKTYAGHTGKGEDRIRKTFNKGETVFVSPLALARAPNLMSSAQHKALAEAERAEGQRQRDIANAIQGEREETENALEDADTAKKPVAEKSVEKKATPATK